MSKFKSGFVSIVGRPNVGKSTLLNYIIGKKVAIVSDKPQTTRNKIQAVKNFENAQVVFIDTPGVHKPIYKMNQYMLRTALNALDGMDILLVMVDINQPPGKGDEFLFANLPKENEKKYLLINKIDTVNKPKILETIVAYDKLYEFDEIIPVSAKNGEGMDKVESLILENIPEGPRYFDDEAINYTDSFLAAEIIREKVLKVTKEELPYSTAVMVESWEELEKHERIHAVIFVDKQSHKKIIIGKGGSLMKKIGTDARLELERIFGTKIYLELWVKVKSKWRDDDRLLNEMGLKGQF